MNDIKGIIEDCNKSDLVSDKIIKKIIEIIGQEEWQDLHDENNDICTTMGELIITLKGIADLEKENADLKSECRTCVYTDSPCVLSDYPSKDGVCSHYKNVFEENAELRNNGFTVSAMTEQQLKVALEKGEQLEKENEELKESFFAVRCVRSGCPYLHLETRNCLKVGGFFTAVSNKHCPMMQNLNSSIQLTTAKEIISEYINILKGDTKNWKKTQEKAEQFLSDIKEG